MKPSSPSYPQTPAELRALMQEAIARCRRLSFIYHGELCIVNPLALERSNGKAWELRAVQAGGQNRNLAHSRSFELDCIESCRMLPDRFYQHPLDPSSPF